MSYINEQKFADVIKAIYNNIDQPINLATIAAQSGLSLSTMKRLFKEAVGVAPGVFIKKLRLELAFETLHKDQGSVLNIALSTGFDDQSAFARSFKQKFGCQPTRAKEKINIVNELECVVLETPNIVKLKDIVVQAVTKQGYYFESAPQAWSGLKSKLGSQSDLDEFSGLFIGIGHDNPHDGKVTPDKVRFSAGVSCFETDLGINAITIESGRYAKFRFHGKPNNLGLAYHYIFGKWLNEVEYVISKCRVVFTVFENIPNAMGEYDIIIFVPLNVK